MLENAHSQYRPHSLDTANNIVKIYVKKRDRDTRVIDSMWKGKKKKQTWRNMIKALYILTWNQNYQKKKKNPLELA